MSVTIDLPPEIEANLAARPRCSPRSVSGFRGCAMSLPSLADGGYAGETLAAALVGHGQWQIEIVKRSDRATGFQLLPLRWVVERTFAWLSRNRRLAKDFETTIAGSETWSTSPPSNCSPVASLALQPIARRRKTNTIPRFPVRL